MYVVIGGCGFEVVGGNGVASLGQDGQCLSSAEERAMVSFEKGCLFRSLGLRQRAFPGDAVQLPQASFLGRGKRRLHGGPQRFIAQQVHGRQFVS